MFLVLSQIYYSCGPFSVSCGPSILPQIYNRFVAKSVGIGLIALVGLDLSWNEGEHLRDDG